MFCPPCTSWSRHLLKVCDCVSANSSELKSKCFQPQEMIFQL
ncbi:rCG42577, partial [Rattus norvegicus]